MRPQSCKLLWFKLKRKVQWESILISLELLEQSFRADAIDFRKFGIKHDTLASNHKD